MTFNYRAVALLPTSTNINPSQPEDATYFDSGQVAYILQRVTPGKSAKIVAATSFGHLGESFALGTVHEVAHDQTRRNMGDFKVIGIAEFSTGKYSGERPARKIAHWVFK